MTQTHIEQLLWQRKSARAFLSTPVAYQDVARILTAARQAPSGANLQPGRFYALTGRPLAALSNAIAEAIASDRPPVSEYSYFPTPLGTELKSKQRAAGYALYQALGIERRDLAGRKAQFMRNYQFFDAPVGIVVTIQRDMGNGCFMDLGMAMMALQLAAQGMGYATCGIGALANHADVVHECLELNDDELVVCGIALGHADISAAANQFETDRDPLEDFATLSGFDR